MYIPILDILERDGDYNLKIENISGFLTRLTRQNTRPYPLSNWPSKLRVIVVFVTN